MLAPLLQLSTQTNSTEGKVMPTAQQILSTFNQTHSLGLESMDAMHIAFLELCDRAASAKGPAFAETFQLLFEHTRDHFSEEEARMLESGYTSYAEHRADHQRTLGDMERFAQRAAAGRATMARAWLLDNLPAWFDLHTRNMDSALAAHLKNYE